MLYGERVPHRIAVSWAGTEWEDLDSIKIYVRSLQIRTMLLFIKDHRAEVLGAMLVSAALTACMSSRGATRCRITVKDSFARWPQGFDSILTPLALRAADSSCWICSSCPITLPYKPTWTPVVHSAMQPGTIQLKIMSIPAILTLQLQSYNPSYKILHFIDASWSL